MTKECEICKTPFYVKPGKAEKRFCCSGKCKAERLKYSTLGILNNNYKNGKTKTFNCVVCGSEFKKDTYNKSNPLKTCSKKCYLKNISNTHRGKSISLAAISLAKTTKRETLEIRWGMTDEQRKTCSCGNKKEPVSVTCQRCFYDKIKRKFKCVVCGRETKKPKRVTTCGPICASRKKQMLYAGSKNPNWKGGVKTEHQRIRNHLSYKEWRFSVYKRDNYTCQDCGKTNCYLHAHHIKEFSKFPEERMSIDNGKTLCVECHKKYHPSMNIKRYKTQVL